MDKFCRNCGHLLDAGVRYCSQCGTRVNVESNHNAEEEKGVEREEKVEKVVQQRELALENEKQASEQPAMEEPPKEVAITFTPYKDKKMSLLRLSDVFSILCIALFIAFLVAVFLYMFIDDFAKEFGISFLILCVFLTIISLRLNSDEKKKYEQQNEIYKLWTSCEHDFALTLQKVMETYKLTELESRQRLTTCVLSQYALVNVAKECNCDKEKMVDVMYRATSYDKTELARYADELIKAYTIRKAKAEKEEEKKKAAEAKEKKNEEAREFIERKVATQPVSKKKQYKANKRAGFLTCPKCGSTSITTTNKKISAGKGVAGGVVGNILMPGVGTVVGAAVGATSSKKIYNVCMNCGHRWKP